MRLGAINMVAPDCILFFSKTKQILLIARFIDTNVRLSEHFCLREFLVSATAQKHHIPNVPLKCHITALTNLCVHCLEPIRRQLGLPIQVTSGYRCPMLNTLVGGVETSQHLRGEAADITIPLRHRPFAHITHEQTARLLMNYARQYADFDQLILEHSATTWWLHISCRINRRKNRHQVIINLEKK